MGERTCDACGAAFVVLGKEFRPRRRCYDCRPKQLEPCPCAGCGRMMVGSAPPGVRTCHECRRTRPGYRPTRAPVGSVACVDCGTDFVKRGGGVRCSACASVWRAEYRRARDAQRMQPPTACEYCGTEFTCRRQSKPVRFCSNSCAVRSRSPRSRKPLETVVVVPWAACLHCRCWFVARAGRRTHDGRCAHKLSYVNKPARCRCGVVGPVLKRQGQWSCAQCKEAARKREQAAAAGMSNHRKRARYYGVRYEPIKKRAIFERDGWRCGICNKKVDRRLKFPHPMSASLDHIIPMSLGGPHLLHNVQCSHFGCNSRKCANPAGEQLLLVG